MGAGRAMNAWGKRGRFTYQGDLERGTRIKYGHGKSFIVPPSMYRELLTHFSGATVAIGLSRNPARHSLGSWLRARIHEPEVPVAYVGPLLVAEGAAERVGTESLAFVVRRPEETLEE